VFKLGGIGAGGEEEARVTISALAAF